MLMLAVAAAGDGAPFSLKIYLIFEQVSPQVRRVVLTLTVVIFGRYA